MLRKLLMIGFLGFALNLSATKITKEECNSKEEGFIWSKNECINYVLFEGDDNEDIVILVHGSWKAGTNILGRYLPFAETLNMNTDKTIIAIALPGYSKSSSNVNPPLEHDAKISPSEDKNYISFVAKLIENIKEKYDAKNITYVGHSAGARIGATLMGTNPELIQNVVLVGGSYKTKKENKNNKNVISFEDVIDSTKKENQYIFIYGTKDKISEPQKSIQVYNQMKEKGYENIKLIKVEGGVHLDLEMTDSSVEAITNIFE